MNWFMVGAICMAIRSLGKEKVMSDRHIDRLFICGSIIMVSCVIALAILFIGGDML